MNAFFDKRLAVLERAWLEPRKPRIIIVRGGFPPDDDDEQPPPIMSFNDDRPSITPTPKPRRTPSSGSGRAHTVHPQPQEGINFSRPSYRPVRSQAWSQRAGESVDDFYGRVLAEAGEVPFIVFYGLAEQGDLQPAYRDDPPGWSDAEV
jgi:hypothetical protein